MAERTESSRINTYINTAGAVPALKELNTEFLKLQAEQKKFAQGSEDWKKVQKEMDSMSKKMTDYTKTVDKSVMSTKQLGEYSRQLRKMRDDLVPGTKAWSDLDKEITATHQQMKGATQSTNIFSKGMSSLGNLMKTHPLIFLAGILAAIVAAFKSNDTVMRVVERTMGVLGTTTGLLVDKVEMVGKYLLAAFQNPKKAMQDLYEFVKQNLINRFTAFGVILEGIMDLDFKKVANGVIQAGTGVENMIDKVGEMGKEFADVAKAQDEIVKANQRLRDEERKLLVLNKERQGQYDILLERSKDMSLSVSERNKALQEATAIENSMFQETMKLEEEKLKLIQKENSLSSSNEEARQREADQEAKVVEMKMQNQLRLQQIKTKGSKLDIKENKEAAKEEQERQKLIEQRVKLEEEYLNQVAKFRDEARRKNLSSNERELDDVHQKYAKAFAIAAETGQDITELEKLYSSEVEAVKQKQFDKETELRKANFDKVKFQLMTEQERELAMLEEKYQAILELDGVTHEQQIELERLKQEAIAEIEKSYQEKSFEDWQKVQEQKIKAIEEYHAFANQVASGALQIAKNLEDRELQQDKAKNDAKKKNLEQQKKSGRITEEEYNRQIEKMEADLDKKQKETKLRQFQRDKAFKLLNIAMDTATGIMKAIAQFGPPPSPMGIAGIAAAGITGGIQAGVVASQSPPELAEGGIMDKGVSHDHPSGGMPILDPVTGQVLAKMEVGESILPVDTTEENRPLIEMMLANKGRRITPEMLINANAVPRVNHAGISSGVQANRPVTKLENGGFMDKTIKQMDPVQSNNGGGGTSFEEVVNAIRSVQNAVENLELIISTEDLSVKLKEQERLKERNRLK